MTVHFSDFATKYNRHNKGQKRILCITEAGLYVILPDKYVVRRRIPIREVKWISLSRMATDVLIVHCKTEHGMEHITK